MAHFFSQDPNQVSFVSAWFFDGIFYFILAFCEKNHVPKKSIYLKQLNSKWNELGHYSLDPNSRELWIVHYIEVRFASFQSGGFITATVVNPPD